MSGYLCAKYSKELDNSIIDISCQDINDLCNENIRDEEECKRITGNSNKGNDQDRFNPENCRFSLYKEVYKDTKTSGFVMQYPHGTIITQAKRNNYYRGENQIYPYSIPTLSRTLKQFTMDEDKEIYKFITDMRIGEFGIFLFLFDYVKNWERNYGTVLFDSLAQHYGLETNWLDITNDFNVALFFATCFFDHNEKRWKPLTRNETEKDEGTKYGMIFHIPQWQVDSINGLQMWQESQNEKSEGMINNIIPIGFQPFMRCHTQYGYGIKMETEYPLQNDFYFEKMRFRHSETLSRKVFDLMDQGKKIFPHEGLLNFQDIIDQLKTATTFSDEAFDYAFDNSCNFIDKDSCRAKILTTKICGEKITIKKNTHPIHVSRQRRRRLDREYAYFSIEKEYEIKLVTRRIEYES